MISIVSRRAKRRHLNSYAFLWVALLCVGVAPAWAQSNTLRVSKAFDPTTVPAGTTSQMTVTLYNTDTAGPQTGVALTDNMPAGLTWTGLVSNTCGGSLSAPGASLTLAGGTVSAATGSGASSCTIVVNVTAPVTGTYTNTITSGGATGQVNGNPTANANPASSSLTVITSANTPVTGGKAFTPSTMALGETGSFTIRINNPNTFAISGIAFSDNLAGGSNVTSTPAGGSLNPTAVTGNTCGGTAGISGGAVNLSGGTIPAEGFCTVTVSFTATQAATYTNTLPPGAITVGSHPGLGNAGNISANLAVQDSAVTMTKAFDVDEATYPNPFVLTLTFRNNTSSAINGLAVSDDFADSNSNGTPDLVVSEIAPQVVENTCGGTVVANPLATGFSLSGGTIAAGDTCRVRIRVRASQDGVPDFTHTNTTGSCSGSIAGGSAFTCPPASDIVTLRGRGEAMIIGLAKQYLATDIASGTVVRGRIRLMTPESQDIVAFTMPDTFQANTTQGQPSDVVLAPTAGNFTFQDCGAGATATPLAGGNGFTLGNLTINAQSGSYEGNPAGWPNAACVIEFDVEGDVPGTHVNTIPIDQGSGRRATDGAGVTRQGLNRHVSANFTYLSPLSAAKSFSPSVVAHGGVSRLTIRLSNSNDQAPITNLAFTDNLPSAGAGVEVLVASTPNLSNTCGGTLAAAPGSSSVSLSGGAVLAGSVGGVAGLCEIGVDVVVTDAVDGNQDFLNRLAAGTVTGTISGATVSNNGNADASVQVRSVNLGVGKAFSPAAIDGGETSELTITIDNPNAGSWLVNGIRVTDNMPLGMEIADPANASTTCTVDGLSGGAAATVTANPGAGNFTLVNAGLYGSGGGAPAGAMSTCTVTVTVRALISDNLVNTLAVGDVTSSNGAINGNAYSATLVVLPNASVSKRFIPDVIPVGGISELEIEVLNANSDPATNVHVQDTMPTQVTVADPLVVTLLDACPGLNVSATPGSNATQATGLNLGANERCRFRVQVTSQTPGVWTNTIASNQVGSDQGGIRTVNATDDLTVVNGPVVTKSFADDQFPAGETTRLTLRVSNPATGGSPLTNVVFVDNLPSGMTLADPVNMATTGACGTGTVTATAGATSVTWSGGTLGGGEFCEIVVDVTATTVGTYTNVLPACDMTAAPPVAGSSAATTATDGNLTTCNSAGAQDEVEVVEPAELSFVKALAAESIATDNVAQAGEELTYTITISNGSGTAATAVPVIDTVPANTTFVSADNGGALNGGQVEWSVGVPGDSEVVLTVVFRVADPIPAGVTSIANNATVDGEACATTPCVETPTVEPAFTVTKAVTAETGATAGVAEAGEQITYTITVANTAGIDAAAVAIVDVVPANTTFVSASDGGALNGNQVEWTADIPANGSVTRSAVFRVVDPIPAGVASIANSATANGEGCATTPCVETPVGRPQLEFGKVLSAEDGAYAGIVEPGEQLSYVITVTNGGAAAATQVSVVDTLDPNVAFVSADNGGTRANGLVNWTLERIEPGQSIALSVVVRAPATFPADLTRIVNDATVDDEACATRPCVETPVARPPVAVDDDGGINQVGTAVTLATPGNDQPATAPLDPTSVWIVGTAGPNTALTVPGEGVWSVNPATGEITFTPEAGFAGNPTPIHYTIADTLGLRSNEAEERLEYTQDFLLRLSKQASVRTVVVGDLVQYTLTLENIGDIDVVDATVQDTPPNGFTLVPDSLRIHDGDRNGTLVSTYPVRIAGIDVTRGQTATITYLMAVGAGTLPGAHTNTAVVLSNEVPISNEASATVVSSADPLLEQSLIIGTVFNDRDSDAWQDSAKATDLVVKGGIDESVYVAGSTTVDAGEGPQSWADASAPLNHGLELGTLLGRNSVAEGEDAHRIVISQRLREARFADDFTLVTGEGTTLRMDVAGNVAMELSGDAGKGLTAQDIRVRREVTPLDGGEVRVDYIISNAGVDERGIPGVRIGTVEGLLVETDGYGRFHLEGITPSHYARGSNFIMKVDTATLPKGSTFTTENPRVKRVTPGLMARFDFGVKVPEDVIEGGSKELQMDLGEVVFEANSAVVRPQYAKVIEHMAAQVRQHGGGRVDITGFGGHPELALARAKAVHEALLAQLPAGLAGKVDVSARGETDGPEVLTYGQRIRIGEVFFDTDKSAVKPAYDAVIRKIADEVNTGKVNELVVTGHTDKRASDAYNLALGQRRADAVLAAIRAYLTPERRNRIRVEHLPPSSAEAPYESGRGQ